MGSLLEAVVRLRFGNCSAAGKRQGFSLSVLTTSGRVHRGLTSRCLPDSAVKGCLGCLYHMPECRLIVRVCTESGHARLGRTCGQRFGL